MTDQTSELLYMRAKLRLPGGVNSPCLLYTSDAADERSSVELGGRRVIKKKKHTKHDRDNHLSKDDQRVYSPITNESDSHTRR